MLEGGGDLYLGMLYAMNNRYGWHYKNATDMYKIWNDFGIMQSRMLGYWHSENPVKTDNANVLATVYLKENEVLICAYNFSDKAESFSFEFNAKRMGFNPERAFELRFGKGKRAIKNINKVFKLSKRKGIMIYLRS